MTSERARLDLLYGRVHRPGTTTSRGRALEDFVEHVFSQVPSVKLYQRNILDEDGAQELDLVFSHYPNISMIPIPDIIVLVECKNEGRRVSAAQVREFANKLRSRSLPVGILISTLGLSGTKGKHAHRAISDELHSGVALIVATTDELYKLKTNTELAELLFDRLMELKTLRGYRNI